MHFKVYKMSFAYARVDDESDSLILEKEVKFTAGSIRMMELQALLSEERKDMIYLDEQLECGPKDKTSILIDNWNEDELNDELEPDEMRQTIETVFNPDVENTDRIGALNKLFRLDSDDGNMTLTVINHTLSTRPGSHILDTILDSISQIDFSLENSYRLLHMLFLSYPSKRESILDAMERILYTHERKIPSPIRANIIKYLIMNKTHQSRGLDQARDLVFDEDIDIGFRLRFILDLDTIRMPNMNDFSMEKDLYMDWSKKVLLVFVKSIYLSTGHRVIVSNILLGKYSLERDESETVLDILFGIGRSQRENYNTRADALDVVVSNARRFGYTDIYQEANAELHALGVTKSGKDIYSNAQNVHEKSIVQSALNVLTYIEEQISKKNIRVESFDKTRDAFMATVWSQKPAKHVVEKNDPRYIEYKELKRKYRMKVDAISYSLTRISLDYAVYGMRNRTLMDIMCILWAYLDQHQYKDELIQRMEEELIDASGLCSTGHAFRLLNIISGYDEVAIGISIEDEFMAKVQKMLNEYIMNMKDEEKIDSVLGEMTDKGTSLIGRDEYRRFVSNALTNLEPRIWDEFSDRIDHADFNLYMRKALMKYDDEDF